ncbi:MAG: transglycosylase domain-containing protein [Candidatus Cyclobacteriaceae bacterium M2_1C_046]
MDKIIQQIKQLYIRLRSITIYRPGIRKTLIVSLSLLLALLIVPFIFLFAVKLELFGDLPDEQQLQNIRNNVATEIYSADSVLLGKYYYQNRTNTQYENISPHLVNALIATEDARFYRHEGIDLRSWLRVLFKTIIMDKDAGGGSTISQQLVKNLFGRNNNEWLGITKVKEAVIAQKIEDIYTKEEILTLYFNTVPFGEDVFGVETAAERFFNVSASNVNLQQAATLVGMLKANSRYNPRVYPERAQKRRNVVLNQMVKYEYLKPQVADSVKLLPMKTDAQIITSNTGLATYFREFLRQELEEWCSANTKPDGSNYNLYADGLKIYTTLDAELQQYGEEAVRTKMQELQKSFEDHWKSQKPWDKDQDILATAVKRTTLYKNLKEQGKTDAEIKKAFAVKRPMTVFSYEGEKVEQMSVLDSLKHHLMILHSGLLSIDPQTGYVKTWVGGIDHKFFKYDHVNVRTKRQVGSTFKPVVYTAALQNGSQPCEYISAELATYTDDTDTEWTPGNSDNEYTKRYSMAGALMNSVNTVSVKIFHEAGLDHTISLAKAMGIESTIPEVPSIALGTMEASLYEMVKVYCTYANDGAPIKPTYLLAITDQNGEILEKGYADVTRDRVIDKTTNAIMIEMMKGVINEGTASRLRWKYNITNDVAGKTGTTQNNADGWFIGITPRLVTGVWVGADDPRIRFRYTNLGQGASTAVPVFASYFKKINKDEEFSYISEAKFPTPPQDLLAQLNCAPFIEETPSLFEMLFGKKDKNEEDKEEAGDDDLNFFERLFKRRNKDN